MRNLLLMFLLLGFYTICFAQHYTIDEIPNPKTKGQNNFVSNPDGILNNADTLNKLIAQIEKATKIEMAVVVVNDFEKEEDDFDFALNLFNNWKIGKAGSKNGLLLFVAKNRKRYRFISGDGIEGILPDIILKRTGENMLVPAFKEGDYSNGVLNAVNEISVLLTNPDKRAEIDELVTKSKQNENRWKLDFIYSVIIILLFIVAYKLINKQALTLDRINKDEKENFLWNALFTIPLSLFISIPIVIVVNYIITKTNILNLSFVIYTTLAVAFTFKYIGYLQALREQYNDDQNFIEAVKAFHQKNWWLILFSPFIVIGFIFYQLKYKKLAVRFIPIKDKGNNLMQRVDRDANIFAKEYLSDGQRREEGMDVYKYDIWISKNDLHEIVIKSWPGDRYKKFTECSKCNFRTLSIKSELIIIEKATYKIKGEGKKIKRCNFCDHEEFIKTVVIPIKSRYSGGSGFSSSGSSGSSSSSSSSSGSWGGGSSSGGGAGGSW